eukprot:365084-Chlamydomonas_euryale.AAC.15
MNVFTVASPAFDCASAQAHARLWLPAACTHAHAVLVKVEDKPFAAGAMRECFAMKKLSTVAS